ncbi:MAG: hypothetical protein HFE86_05490 [Clostridiales bacterium]|nr:hypothetical protein [Clostridiales bacterium]
MTAIMLCGRQDRALPRELSRVLSVCGGVCLDTDEEISVKPECRFLLVQKDRPPRWRTQAGVCVLPPDTGGLHRWQVPAGFVAVAPSDAPAALRMLERQGAPAVACGMSAADTVTLSSIHEGRAVVCLQRVLTTLSGEKVEPGDYPIGLAAPISPYGLMAGIAILLLAGEDPAAALTSAMV